MTKTDDAMRRELADLRENLDQRARDRADLIVKAQQLAPNVVLDAGLSDDEIRARAVSYARGVQAIDGKSSDYIHALFDHLADLLRIDPVTTALRTGLRAH